MSSLPVAARSGSALPRVPLGFVALMLILAVGIGLAVGANVVATSSRSTVQTPAVTTPKHHSATPPRAVRKPPIWRIRNSGAGWTVDSRVPRRWRESASSTSPA